MQATTAARGEREHITHERAHSSPALYTWSVGEPAAWFVSLHLLGLFRSERSGERMSRTAVSLVWQRDIAICSPPTNSGLHLNLSTLLLCADCPPIDAAHCCRFPNVRGGRTQARHRPNLREHPGLVLCGCGLWCLQRLSAHTVCPHCHIVHGQKAQTDLGMTRTRWKSYSAR